MKLQDSVVALTGAGSGIGRALAFALVDEGARVALADRDAPALDDVCAQLPPGAASRHVLDVADEAAVAAYAVEAVRVHGRVDCVINNAGVSIHGTFAELSVAEIRWLLDINFYGTVHGIKAFLPHLLARPQAYIVNLSSVFGLFGPPGQSAYAASKFAVCGLSESLRGELSETRVRVLTVHPGGIKTAIARTSRVAAAADAGLAAQAARDFEATFLKLPPAMAAVKILGAIKRDRERLLIGSDARAIDVLTRLLGPRAARVLNARARAHIGSAVASEPPAVAPLCEKA